MAKITELKTGFKKQAGKARNYAEKSARNLVDSFRNLDKHILFIVAYRLIFYAAGIFLVFKLNELLLSKAETTLGIDINVIRAGPGPEIAAAAEAIKSFYNFMIAYIVLFALAIFAVYIITNFLIWAGITGKKLKKTKPVFAGKFILIKICWVAVLLLIFIVIVQGVKQEVMIKWLAGLALVYSHLTAVMYIAYFKRGNAVKSVKKAFAVGFGKFHHFIVPYIFAYIIFFILNKILVPLQNFQFRFSKASIVIFIIFLFYFAWLRIYIYSFAKDLV